MFSRRVPGELAANRLSTAAAALRARGEAIVDLTESNPTRAGFSYPPALLESLADPRGLRYEPHPRGLLSAREAIAAEYARRGLSISADRIVLTASTSEAYGFLFKLLADAGDEILVPRPSYPLFEHLTTLEVLAARPYDLDYHGAWSIDFESIERSLSKRTRAVLVVSPNNPTGSYVTQAELDRLAALCAPRGIAIIVDAVFSGYPLDVAAARRAGHVLERTDVLGFALGGLSKSIGMPQLKLGWILVAGPPALASDALDRLEFINDTYLSVATPVQAAAGDLLAAGAAVREQIRTRIGANYRSLLTRAASTPSCSVLKTDGGWYAVVQVPSLQSEDELVLSLLEQDRVLVHPGYFFDFRSESYLVVSLLPVEPEFVKGVEAIFRRFDGAGRV